MLVIHAIATVAATYALVFFVGRATTPHKIKSFR